MIAPASWTAKWTTFVWALIWPDNQQSLTVMIYPLSFRPQIFTRADSTKKRFIPPCGLPLVASDANSFNDNFTGRSVPWKRDNRQWRKMSYIYTYWYWHVKVFLRGKGVRGFKPLRALSLPSVANINVNTAGYIYHAIADFLALQMPLTKF